MINKEEVLALKVSGRCCRKRSQPIGTIQAIVNECSVGLGIEQPDLICCDSLTRNFSAFYLMGRPYIIFDSCLIETLYLYNYILFSGNIKHDMDKFFYKLFGEECIRVGDLSHALYFSGKYREMEFTFDKEFGRNKQLTEQISYQSYFLVAHELCHIMLQSSRIQSIPTGYCDFVRAAVGVLTERDLKKLDQKINVYAAERMKYFQAETIPESIDEYLDIIKSSERYGHFLEECYCDFMGFKLLTEQYTSPQIAVNAISRVLNYLITQESIRSDFSNGAEHLRDTTKEALPTMYYSVLRVQLLLLTLEINDMEEVERAVAAVHQRSRLTDRLSTFIESLPDGEAMRKVSDSDLPEISKERLTKALIQAFHYCSVADK